MSVVLIFVIALVVIFALVLIGIYNRLVALRQTCRQGVPTSTLSCASGTIWCPTSSIR